MSGLARFAPRFWQSLLVGGNLSIARRHRHAHRLCALTEGEKLMPEWVLKGWPDAFCRRSVGCHHRPGQGPPARRTELKPNSERPIPGRCARICAKSLAQAVIHLTQQPFSPLRGEASTSKTACYIPAARDMKCKWIAGPLCGHGPSPREYGKGLVVLAFCLKKRPISTVFVRFAG